MKDESAFLQARQPPSGLHPEPAPHDPTVVHLPLYHRGTRVVYEGQYCTVGHVVISRSPLLVYLQEPGISVSAEKVQLAPRRLVLQRH